MITKDVLSVQYAGGGSEKKMRLGEVLSGFTFHGNYDKLIVSYREHRRSGRMDCIGITQLNCGSLRTYLGLAYVKCRFDDVADIMTDVDVKTIETKIEHYCLVLPLIDDGNFEQEFATVFDDWDVSDEYYRKFLPNLCPILFQADVMS